MKHLLTLLLFISTSVFSETIIKKCISDSGLSEFRINLNMNALRGVADYKFSGQDITYEINKLEIQDDVIHGLAMFVESRTGETKGNSFVFIYDKTKNLIFDGDIQYFCN